jgi:hypothetical protein
MNSGQFCNVARDTIELNNSVDKSAASECFALEPFGEDSKNYGLGCSNRFFMALNGIFKPRHPIIVSILKIRLDEVEFAWKVSIKSNFGNASLFDYAINPCGPNSILIKEVVSFCENTISGAWACGFCSHLVSVDKSVHFVNMRYVDRLVYARCQLNEVMK